MTPRAKQIVLLGATGSIGESTLEVLRKYRKHFELVGIAAKKNFRALAKIAEEFNVREVCIFDEKCFMEAKVGAIFPKNCILTTGEEGLEHLVTRPKVDVVVLAMTGIIGIKPALAAIELGRTIALANKEILVMAGAVIMEAAKKYHATILPIDSEHNAIFQCLQGEENDAIHSIILTASGGAFRDYPKEALHNVTPEDALKHPTWIMGQKVTIDCATMANKGLELIEAHWLFNVGAEKLKVLIHPQSIIHSMVQFVDGSVKAQLSPTSMTFPIQNCLLYPKRFDACKDPLDFSQFMKLELFPPDMERYPCLRLAIEALKAGGLACTIFNAANEVAVEAFIGRKLPFLKISDLIDKTMEKVFNGSSSQVSFPLIIEMHNYATEVAKEKLNEL